MPNRYTIQRNERKLSGGFSHLGQNPSHKPREVLLTRGRERDPPCIAEKPLGGKELNRRNEREHKTNVECVYSRTMV
jgi:hypothetical protein